VVKRVRKDRVSVAVAALDEGAEETEAEAEADAERVEEEGGEDLVRRLDTGRREAGRTVAG